MHFVGIELRVTEPPQQQRRGDPAGDRADALARAEDAEEGGRPVEDLLDDREDQRLGEATTSSASPTPTTICRSARVRAMCRHAVGDVPPRGASSVGTAKVKKTSPASALEPVSDFAQMPRTS